MSGEHTSAMSERDQDADRPLLERIDAEITALASDSRFEVRNPASGTVIAQVPDQGAAETQDAIARAKAAFPSWAAKTAKDRGQVLQRWHALIVANQRALAVLLTREQGKPLAEAMGEILFGATFIEWFAEEAKRIYGDVIPTNSPTRRLLVLKQPIGVVGAITPWNFPSAMVTRKVAPALAAGCTIVLKPAEDTPLSALALQLLAKDAGFPDGVFQVITSARAEPVANVLTASPDVRKISFTGSTRVGKLLMKQCSDTLKKLSLELGGNAPYIVFDDADLDAAVEGAIMAKFRNAGQTCVSANRILVQRSVMEPFAEKLAAAATELPVGDGFAADTAVGPLINQAAVKKVGDLVQTAIGSGARLVQGGAGHPAGDNFYAPTVLSGVTPDMEIAQSEIFGPVATLFPFDSDDDAVRISNDTRYGLAAYFWTRDLSRAWRVAEALEFGMVGINEWVISSEAAPFGGIKESGIGREGSRYGIDDYVEIKYVAMGGL